MNIVTWLTSGASMPDHLHISLSSALFYIIIGRGRIHALLTQSGLLHATKAIAPGLTVQKAAVRGSLFTLKHSIVSNDPGNSEPIIPKCLLRSPPRLASYLRASFFSLHKRYVPAQGAYRPCMFVTTSSPKTRCGQEATSHEIDSLPTPIRV